jgi:dolichol kinase
MEFRITIVVAVLCYLLRVVADYVFYPYFYKVMDFASDEQDRIVRATKLTDKTYSGIYHVFVITYGFIVLSNTEYFPRMLGGRGNNDFSMIWSEFPCIRTGGYEESLRMYYLVTLGYRVFKTYLLIYQWFRNEHRSDYIEMFLHHTLTIALYGFSFMIGWVKIGSVIMYCHDLVEPLLNGSKILVETKANKAATGVSVILLWIVWFWSRLFVFPQIIYLGLWIEAPKQLYPNHGDVSHLDHQKFG